MCGIFGIVSKNSDRNLNEKLPELLEHLFLNSEIRGMEATGIALKSHELKSIAVLRKSITASQFLKSSNYSSFKKEYLNATVLSKGYSIIGHTRIATNGYVSFDNQPIEKNGVFGVHNGIVCNIDSLWDKHKNLDRKQVIDTELLLGLIKENLDRNNGHNINSILFNSYAELEGTASIGLIFDTYSSMILGTNCGSLYYYLGDDYIAFASESLILSKAISSTFGNILSENLIQLIPTSFATIDEKNLEFTLIKNSSNEVFINKHDKYISRNRTTEKPIIPFFNTQPESKIRAILENNIEAIKKIKRCTKCILPETHPFIDFDTNGVCNYCRDYKNRRTGLLVKGMEEMEILLAPLRKIKGNNCIMMLSGGRDSCYGMHIVKKELGLNPIAFSYDWGMLTDLGRRNQARMCDKLGVEHVIVSADIKMKRRNVKLNVEAFLAKPHLGTIGLFMAGDKAYHHFAKVMSDNYNLKLIGGGCPLEHTYFKEGFSGIEPYFMRKRTIWDRLDIVKFFISQTLRNPRLLNASIPDNLLAYKYYYMTVLDVVQLFRYFPWDENNVNNTLVNEYNWELANDTPTSWRIGDGTAAFYNYIYYTVAGFTENDCLRSNQILEGVITREDALKLVEKENAPRYESLKWYCDTISVDLEYAIKQINKIPKLYNNLVEAKLS
jgi:glucosamine--fructose-6-phosphate aminotransferase (isomerizing)